MAGLDLSEDERGVAENGGESIIEIEGDGASEVQRAIKLLFVSDIHLNRLLRLRRRRGSDGGFPAAHDLKDQLLVSMLFARTNERRDFHLLVQFVDQLEFARSGWLLPKLLP